MKQKKIYFFQSVVDYDNMSEMFSLCSSLQHLDLTNFNIQNVNNLDKIFYGCISLKKDKLNKLKDYVFIYSGNTKNNGGNPPNNMDQHNQKKK